MVELDPQKIAQVANCLEGVALGDATGAEVEMMTPEEILASTGGTGVTGPGTAVDPSKRKVPDTRNLAPNTTTDDWGLTSRVGQMYAQAGHFDIEILALLQLMEFRRNRAGYGATTMIAFWEMEKYYLSCRQASLAHLPPPNLTERERKRWGIAKPRHPALPAQIHGKNGSGNGPPMKIAPTGLFHALRGWDPADHEPVLSEVMQISFMTHGDPIPGVAAYALATAIGEIIRRPADDASRLEEIYLTALEAARVAESRFVYMMKGEARFSDRLIDVREMSQEGDGPRAIRAMAGQKTSLAIETVPAAFGFFFLHPLDPKAAVLAAANAGGDADTIASMVGALCGANATSPHVWAGWRENVPACKDARRLAHELASTAGYPMGARGLDTEDLKRELGFL